MRTNEPQRVRHPVWILECIAAPVVDVVALINRVAVFVDPALADLIREAECRAMLSLSMLRAFLRRICTV